MSRKTVKVATRNLVFERDGWTCCACRSQRDLTIQHRINRGMGGSKLLDEPDNLIALCWSCNTLLESNAERARLGRDMGWKLDSWEHPACTGVYRAVFSRWVYLRGDGSVLPAEGRTGRLRVECEACEWAGHTFVDSNGRFECPQCGAETPFG